MKRTNLEGQISLAFKPEAPESVVEEALAKLTHEKVFPGWTLDPSQTRDANILARAYVVRVSPGTENAVVEALKLKYGNHIEYVEQVAARRRL
ncbi:hypothetical protein HZB03_00455 [Candidatus Woesearchaeota archaeon]|nr:hypothetical protein [Candidatus Woesearchaeota archaeon]